MGEIRISDLSKLLVQSESAVINIISKFESLSKCELEMLIIVLCQYLYSKYANYGRLHGDIIYITAINIEYALNGTIWDNYAKNLVKLRNMLCHDYGSIRTERLSYNIHANLDELRKFLMFLGFTVPSNSIRNLLSQAEGN